MKNLKKRREKAGIPQWKFAELMGVDARTVRYWESGKIAVKKGYLDRIESLLRT
jgi:DNA-binding transcriptional regulator YiaG